MVQCQDLLNHQIKSFHVSQLKTYDASRTNSIVKIAEVDTDEWLVEKIVDHLAPAAKGRKKSKKDYLFKVRWAGFGPEEDSWLTFVDVRDLQALDVYLKDHPALGL
eukprot:ANDGO_01534.mRNA.1 hypothetical protein ABB37_10147